MTKVKIDSKGFLHINRGGKLKPQICPFFTGDMANCGDWCPHFSEPEAGADGLITIWLCGSGEWECRVEEFADERVF